MCGTPAVVTGAAAVYDGVVIERTESAWCGQKRTGSAWCGQERTESAWCGQERTESAWCGFVTGGDEGEGSGDCKL